MANVSLVEAINYFYRAISRWRGEPAGGRRGIREIISPDEHSAYKAGSAETGISQQGITMHILR